jgi:hypothetical protein
LGVPQPAHHGSLFYFLLPFIEQQDLYNSIYGDSESGAWGPNVPISTFLSPSSLNVTGISTWFGNGGVTNYPANGFVFQPDGNVYTSGSSDGAAWAPGVAAWNTSTGPLAKIPTTFMDGTSGVIMFTEGYSNCNGVYQPGGNPGGGGDFMWGQSGLGYTTAPGRPIPMIPHPSAGSWFGRPNFPNVPLPQWFPDPLSCNGLQVQSHQVGGILVGLGDGSCRVVSDTVSQQTWQSAILPNDNINPNDIPGGGW